MGIEFNGHEFEWFKSRCKFCGMRREDAYRSDRPCSGQPPHDSSWTDGTA